MIALVKLLLTAAAIGGAVAGVRSLIARGRQAREQARPSGNEPVETELCPACQIYVTAGCQRPDCPLA